MALKYSSLVLLVVVLVLLPITIILSMLSPFGSTGVLLTLMLWILLPVVIAKLYYRFSKKEEL